jgi:hypothetical protein
LSFPFIALSTNFAKASPAEILENLRVWNPAAFASPSPKHALSDTISSELSAQPAAKPSMLHTNVARLVPVPLSITRSTSSSSASAVGHAPSADLSASVSRASSEINALDSFQPISFIPSASEVALTRLLESLCGVGDVQEAVSHAHSLMSPSDTDNRLHNVILGARWYRDEMQASLPQLPSTLPQILDDWKGKRARRE